MKNNILIAFLAATSTQACEFTVDIMGQCAAHRVQEQQNESPQPSWIGQQLISALTSCLWGDCLPEDKEDGTTHTDLHKRRRQGQIVIGMRF